MASWRVFMIGALAFLLPFGLKTGQRWRNWHIALDLIKQPTCRYNLKALFVVARLCSNEDRFPFPPPFHIIQGFWVDSGRPVLMTPEIGKFLGFVSEGTYINFRGILLCARDPKYLLKGAMRAQGLPYEPSYRWRPDALTLAECPYCRLAITLDGRLRER